MRIQPSSQEMDSVYINSVLDGISFTVCKEERERGGVGACGGSVWQNMGYMFAAFNFSGLKTTNLYLDCAWRTIENHVHGCPRMHCLVKISVLLPETVKCNLTV